MAQVETAIYGNLLRPPKSVAEYSAEMDQAEQNRLGLQQSRMNLLGAQQAQQDQQAMRALYQQPDFNPQTDEGIKQLMRISPQAGAAAMKARQDAMKAEADLGHVNAQTAKEKVLTEKEQLQTAIAKQSQLGQVARAAKSQADWDIGLQIAQSLGIDVSQVPKVFSPDTARVVADQVMTGAQQLEQVWKQKGYDLEVSKAGEQVRHNKASEGLTARGQDMADRRASEQASQGKVPAGYRQNPDGTLVFIPGGPADPSVKAKPIPAQANTAIMTNSQNISKVQQAIDLLDGKKVGALEGDPNATGVKGYLPNGMLNRLDPKGVDTRAMISDIGSLIVHDRSGAAVTAAETPRLLPFIPLATDDKATARKKLVRFKQIYEQEANALESAYGADAGYKARPDSPSKPSKSVVRTGTLNGRKVVQYDDGTTDYAD